MRNEVGKKSSTEYTSPLLMWIIIALVFFFIGRFSSDPYNPRTAINNRDTIYNNDSGFAIRVYIDSVFEVEGFYESDDPRNR